MITCFQYGLQDPRIFDEWLYCEIGMFIEGGHRREMESLKGRVAAIVRGLSKKPFDGLMPTRIDSKSGLNRKQLVKQWFFGNGSE